MAAAILERMLGGEEVPAQDILLAPVGVATRQSTDVVAITDSPPEAVRFIRDHANERITVDELQRAVPMSRTTSERKFKQSLDCTPHEYILRVRIQLVKTLLSTTDLTLVGIAERAGFETCRLHECGVQTCGWNLARRVQ